MFQVMIMNNLTHILEDLATFASVPFVITTRTGQSPMLDIILNLNISLELIIILVSTKDIVVKY
jgi:hypothetical protein